MYKIPANTLFMGQKLIYVPECHSTNTVLNELNDSMPLPEGAVVITDHQTAGRGQRGNQWESEKGKNLMFSSLLKPSFLEAKDQFRLNMAVSLAVISSLKIYTSELIKLKWPNDIYIGKMKIGGILIENQLKGAFLSHSVIGIGLNINQENFTSPGASSLINFSGIATDLNEVFHRLIASLEAEYLDLRARTSAQLKERYMSSLYKYNELNRFESEGRDFSGSIRDIDENGRLCVETVGGMRVFSFKEVKFL